MKPGGYTSPWQTPSPKNEECAPDPKDGGRQRSRSFEQHLAAPNDNVDKAGLRGGRSRVLRRAIRKAKRDTWNNFLQEADQEDMWKAVRCTTLRESVACNALTDELGNTATTITEKEMIVRTAFPPPPEDDGYQVPKRRHDVPAGQPTKGRKSYCRHVEQERIRGGQDGSRGCKALWDWGPCRITALTPNRIPLTRMEDSQRDRHPQTW